MTTKSPGHIAFFKLPYSEPVEVYQYGDAICVAPVSNVIDVDTGYRLGRFECYAHSRDRLIESWRQMGGKDVEM